MIVTNLEERMNWKEKLIKVKGKTISVLKEILYLITDIGPKLSIFIMVSFLAFSFLNMPPDIHQPQVNTVTKTYTGQLGMVNYHHTFFGIVDKTTLSFENGSVIATFTFDKDLAVTNGKTYTVTYNHFFI